MSFRTDRLLSQNARAILAYIAEQLGSSRDKANFFLTYKQVHTALGLTQMGDTLGRSLDIQGLGDLARWAHENGLPAVTGLIVSADDRKPGGKFYSLNKRKPDDVEFWLDHVNRSRKFDWKPHLGSADLASVIVPVTAAPVKAEPRTEQASPPTADVELRTVRAYLLIWNPKSYEWKSLESDLARFYQSLSLVLQWGVGNQTSIRPGDRIFFIKVGSEGARGIMGSGYSASFVYEDEHWGGQSGKMAKYIQVSFDVLIDPIHDASLMIPLETLKGDPVLAGQQWRVQSSGISISAPAAARLELLWRRNRLDHLNHKALLASGGDQQVYYEGKTYEIVSKRYERDPEARRQCLRVHGHRCLVCSFDFKETYGALGEGFINVHHLTPIHSRGAEYRVNPESDLVPVCPNCHAMLHRRNPPLKIEELQRLLKGKKGNRFA